MSFGEKLQALRKKSGLSQEDLAEHLNITRQTVSKWELDQSTPELGYIAKLADFYQVSTDYLIRDVSSESADSAAKLPAEAEDDTHKAREGREHAAPVVAIGIILSVIGMIGILVFIILSGIHPIGVLNETGYHEGLAGYLLGTKSVVYFALSVVLMASGLGILIALSAKLIYRKTGSRNI